MGELTGGEAEGFAADLAAFGFAPDQVAQMREDFDGRTARDVFDVMGENVRAVRLLLALQTQWVAVGVGTMATARVIKTGLNYLAIEPAARFTDLGEVTPDDFARLRILEAEALAAWREEAARS